jgi:hypothetical protein
VRFGEVLSSDDDRSRSRRFSSESGGFPVPNLAPSGSSGDFADAQVACIGQQFSGVPQPNEPSITTQH